jgi:hypothetical protein
MMMTAPTLDLIVGLTASLSRTITNQKITSRTICEEVRLFVGSVRLGLNRFH